MMMAVSRPRLVVTGYSRGLGFELVKLLQKEHDLTFVGRSEPPLRNDFADHWVKWDLSRVEDNSVRSSLLSSLQQSPGRIRGVLHSAGLVDPVGEWAEDSLAGADAAMAVNTLCFGKLVGWWLPSLQAFSGQSLVFHFSSGAAVNAYSDLAAYCTSKAAVLMFSRCLAQGLAAENVAVLSVAPGTVDTDMTRPLAHSDPERLPGLQKFRDLKKEGGYANAGDVALQIADFLFSEEQTDMRLKAHGKLYDVRKPGEVSQ